ncbi:unnamed protein product [Coregonus sp. 'balchen']|nr:unnamed protein product [Coregonus sp. 'balchen']
MRVRFDIWEQGNVSPLQLTDKLRGALRHALCDVIMELRVLPNPLCLETFYTTPGRDQREDTTNVKEFKHSFLPRSGIRSVKNSPSPITLIPPPSGTSRNTGPSTPDKPDSSELGIPKTTEDIVQEKGEEGRTRRRHKTENMKQQWSQEKGEEGRTRRRHKTENMKQQWSQEKAMALEEGNVGTLHPLYQVTCQPWITFMAKLDIVNLVSSLASDTTVKVFERISCPQGDIFVPLPLIQHLSQPPATSRTFILIGRNFHQWHCSTEQGQSWRGVAPRQRILLIHILKKKVTLYTYNWSMDLGASLNRGLVRLVQWQNARAHADALLRSPVPSKDQGKLFSAVRSLAPLHFHSELVPFDEALRDLGTGRPLASAQDGADVVARHGTQLQEMKIENLFVTWQQRSAQSNMPISVVDLDTLKQSSRLVHYCVTPLLFDPVFRKQIQEEQIKRHRSSDSTASGRDRSYSTDSADMLPSRLREEPWLQDISNTFLQQYVQYLQSMGFILVQVRPQSPARRSEDSPKGCYFCVKQYALECSRIPMGQTVNSQLAMLFTEECDKVRDLIHVHSFSYDFHLRVVHQYLVGCHMTLWQGYQLTGFLEDFIAHHPDVPKFGRNHVFQGSFSISTGMITAHQLYNYITDHAGTYGMKPLRMSKAAMTSDGKKGAPPSSDLHEYGLVALWNSSGSYKDLEGLRHHDDFDVSLLVCHNAAPFEEQSDGERHLLRLRYYVIMTSQRELFPRLTADMRRFKKLPQIHREVSDLAGRVPLERGTEPGGALELELDLWEETPPAASAPDTFISTPSDGNEFYPLTGPQGSGAQGLLYPSPLFSLLNQEVGCARRQIQASVEQAMGHCRRDNLWRRLLHGEHQHLAMDKLKLSKLSFSELEELLNAVQSRSVGEIDPQLDCFLTMSPSWYQSLIKAVLNQKFTDCFVLVFLDTQAGKTSLKVVFREPLPSQLQPSNSPPPQLVSMYHHLESVINTACFNLWTGLL